MIVEPELPKFFNQINRMNQFILHMHDRGHWVSYHVRRVTELDTDVGNLAQNHYSLTKPTSIL